VLREWSGRANGATPTSGTLRDLAFGEHEFALLLDRGDASVVATPDLVLSEGDRLWCIGPPEESRPAPPDPGGAATEGGKT
jgi:hypothetical protein